MNAMLSPNSNTLMSSTALLLSAHVQRSQPNGFQVLPLPVQGMIEADLENQVQMASCM